MARRPPRPPHALNSNSPLRILTQIFLLQTFYYTSVTGLALFTALTAGRQFSPGLILDWRTVRGDTAMGWTMGVVWGVGGGVTGYVIHTLPPLIPPSYELWGISLNIVALRHLKILTTE